MQLTAQALPAHATPVHVCLPLQTTSHAVACVQSTFWAHVSSMAQTTRQPTPGGQTTLPSQFARVVAFDDAVVAAVLAPAAARGAQAVRARERDLRVGVGVGVGVGVPPSVMVEPSLPGGSTGLVSPPASAPGTKEPTSSMPHPDDHARDDRCDTDRDADDADAQTRGGGELEPRPQSYPRRARRGSTMLSAWRDDRSASTPSPAAPRFPRWLESMFPAGMRRQMVAVGDGLHMHVAEWGEPDARPVLMVHGNPSWGFLYRKVVRDLLEGGPALRLVSPT